MRKFFSVFLLLFAFSSGFAQEVKSDRIIKLNGQTLAVKITAVTEQEIAFTYPNEQAINTLSVNQIKQIDFASGRVQLFAEKAEIKGEADWQKVTVSSLESDIKGLVRKGDVVATVLPATPYVNRAKLDARITEKLKKKAAVLHAHMVLLVSEDEVTKRGVAYGYE